MYLAAKIRERAEQIPLGYSWVFAVAVDVTIAFTLLVATVQRPGADLGMCLLAIAVALVPDVVFFFSGMKFRPAIMWFTSMAAGAIFLFATSTPIASDFAPLLLVLMVSAAVALSSPLAGLAAASSAAALLVVAAQTGRLDGLALYLPVLGMGWLVGFLMQTQRRLMIKQEEAQEALAEHAVTDERRRIAREVHDVIAHSLSITLLHITGARRGLQQDGDIDEAVDALEEAERLGRHAMNDIRRTVGLLESAPMRSAPEPGVEDIAALIADFRRAGLDVTLHTTGSARSVSATVGLALYRITQESLANIAKHAPDSEATVRLLISRRTAELSIHNRLPVPMGAVSQGRGLPGMRQRVELLAGNIDVGPTRDEWQVRASIPLDDDGGALRVPWCRA